VCPSQVSAIRLLAKRCLSLGEVDAALAAEPVVSLLLEIAEADGAVPASADDPYENHRAVPTCASHGGGAVVVCSAAFRACLVQ
jgi:hypothetical protein